MARKDRSDTYNWEREIALYLDNIEAVEGGFTPARMGVIKLKDGKEIFVKIATDDNTKKWIKKEIKVYRILNKAGYRHIPQLLSVSKDGSAMAIEYLKGASFENTWSKPKLEAVIIAQKELMKYKDLFEGDPDFKSEDIIRMDISWAHLSDSSNLEKVNTKLKALGSSLKFSKKQIEEFYNYNKNWGLKENALIHEDIRADNFGYFSDKKEGKLIDWNWLCVGDESLDVTPLFVSMHLSGFNSYAYHPENYDKHVLIYLADFWTESILNGNQDSSEQEWKLRSHQAKSLEACIELINTEL